MGLYPSWAIVSLSDFYVASSLEPNISTVHEQALEIFVGFR